MASLVANALLEGGFGILTLLSKDLPNPKDPAHEIAVLFMHLFGSACVAMGVVSMASLFLTSTGRRIVAGGLSFYHVATAISLTFLPLHAVTRRLEEKIGDVVPIVRNLCRDLPLNTLVGLVFWVGVVIHVIMFVWLLAFALFPSSSQSENKKARHLD